jgi:hypothetical protein
MTTYWVKVNGSSSTASTDDTLGSSYSNSNTGPAISPARNGSIPANNTTNSNTKPRPKPRPPRSTIDHMHSMDSVPGYSTEDE